MSDEKDKAGTVIGWIVCPEPGTETNEKLAKYLAETSEVYEAEHRFIDKDGKTREGFWSASRGHGFVTQVQKFCAANTWAKVTVFKKVSGAKTDRYVEFSFDQLKRTKAQKTILEWLKKMGR